MGCWRSDNKQFFPAQVYLGKSLAREFTSYRKIVRSDFLESPMAKKNEVQKYESHDCSPEALMARIVALEARFDEKPAAKSKKTKPATPAPAAK